MNLISNSFLYSPFDHFTHPISSRYWISAAQPKINSPYKLIDHQKLCDLVLRRRIARLRVSPCHNTEGAWQDGPRAKLPVGSGTRSSPPTYEIAQLGSRYSTQYRRYYYKVFGTELQQPAAF